ncbi:MULTISPECIES: 1-acyl-sn-glycerol-3-phosphate acyltransferase [Rhodomicrobium]|uniref:1-acyl-sn-glycerol-3-phosphate acyltransferase n=1 Tax=Rhodomicrobium TaxID=1068 RepID=UPI000B4B5A44|nr:MULTISPECIES: 1-acyl-sn-glycerol-3-phosphate acyltransferase [Rhodomicrobium]
MGSTVTLPLWLAVLTAGLAVWAILDRLLIPSLRWALRRRANRAIEELNSRLHLRIRPFKSTRRQVLVDRLLFDPDIIEAIEQHARETGIPRSVAMDQARRYAREIVPSFSAYTYFRVGTRLARRLSQLLYRVRVGYTGDLREVDPDASVVFVINHRSNMDYVLVTYVAASASAISYAVGEWAQVWPLRELIRSMGAYFIRRNSRDPLYRRVLARYVATATQAGVVQAVFPEGGLSLDGALKEPKLGLISYMVAGFDPRGPRDVVFIPVGVNYDRVLEDRLLTGAAARAVGGGRAAFKISGRKLLGFIANSFWLMARGRWYRYGYACVSFGKPISLRAYLAERHADLRTLTPEAREAEIAGLGRMLMRQLGKTVPALPVSLVALAMREEPERRLTAFELKGRVYDLMQRLEAEGAYIHIPRQDREYAIDVGVRMLLLRRLILEEDGLYRINPAETVLIAYYANAIAHLAGAKPPAPREIGAAAAPVAEAMV